MNRPIVFDSPFLLGFEHTRSLIERAAKAAAESYPPYNVEERPGGGLRITLAVAGFTPDTLQVTMEDRQLVIAGRRDDAGKAEDAYLHRASPPAASSAASCWPMGWRWRARCWSTACCISISTAPSPTSSSSGYPSRRPAEPSGSCTRCLFKEVV